MHSIVKSECQLFMEYRMIKPDIIKKEDFIRLVILPFLVGSTDTKPHSIVYDLSGKIIFSTKYLKTTLCETNQEIIGKTIFDIGRTLAIAPTFLKKLNNLRTRVTESETAISYGLFINNHKISIAYSVVHVPLFYYDGSIIGSRAIVTNFSWFGHKEYFSAILRPYRSDNKIIRRMNIKLKITPKQHITLFLLSCGFSQNEIATIIEVTRGTVASNIASLCKKFGLNQQNTPLLIKKFNELEIGNIPPKSLLESKIIVLK